MSGAATAAVGVNVHVVARLDELAASQPSRPALIVASVDGGRDDRLVRYGELASRVAACAGGLRARGLAPGDRALILVPMSVELYVAMLGVLAAGAVAVFVDPWVGARRIAAFAARAEPAMVIGTGRTLLLRFLSRRLQRASAITTGGATWGGLVADATLGGLETAGASAPRSAPVAAAEDSALVTFTSGSSGEPKGADRTHGHLMAQHRALAAELPLAAGEVDLTQFPIFALHDLASGATALVPPFDVARPDRVDARAVLARMARHGVATGVASPPFWDRLAAEVRASPALRPALRRLVSGGAPVSDAQLAAWRRAFPDTEIRIVYGSTEAEPVASIAADERLALARASRSAPTGYCAGRLAAGVRARVVRIHRGAIELGPSGWSDWEVAPGEAGELVVAGEHVGRGYYRSPRAFAENKIRDLDGTVWHRMSDTGRIDADGRFWLVGRVHSTVMRDGVAVHAQLVEQAARGEDERIARAAAVGLPDARLGERLVVAIESSADPDAVAAAARARLVDAGLPVDELRISRRPLPLDPRHRSKIDYVALRRRLERR